MKKHNIKLSTGAIDAIVALQHKNGTFVYYDHTLSRLFNFVLDQSDEIGMSSHEAIETLRALDSIRKDLAAIASRRHSEDDPDSREEIAEKVEETFKGMMSEDIDADDEAADGEAADDEAADADDDADPDDVDDASEGKMD